MQRKAPILSIEHNEFSHPAPRWRNRAWPEHQQPSRAASQPLAVTGNHWPDFGWIHTACTLQWLLSFITVIVKFTHVVACGFSLGILTVELCCFRWILYTWFIHFPLYGHLFPLCSITNNVTINTPAQVCWFTYTLFSVEFIPRSRIARWAYLHIFKLNRYLQMVLLFCVYFERRCCCSRETAVHLWRPGSVGPEKLLLGLCS